MINSINEQNQVESMLSQILDKITEELSEAINIIWSKQTLEDNLKKIKSNPELGSIKKRIDKVQECY